MKGSAVLRSSVVAFVLTINACASTRRGTSAVRTFDPVGDYQLSMIDAGQSRNATMAVTGTPGQYGGKINADQRPEVAISTLTVSAQQVTVTGDIPQGMLVLRFRVVGDSVSGDWSLRGQGGRFAGKHRPPQAGR